MLVEDDKSLREIYGVRLQAEGYDIRSAGDGEEALAMAIKERPDLILSDVMMPKISGFDMLDILRSTPETKDIKVIMMTALSSEDQRARGETLGANRYLVKSQVGIEDVVRTIHDLLGDTPNIASTNNAFSVPINNTPTAAPASLVIEQPTEQVLDIPISTPITTPAPEPISVPQPTAPFSTPMTTAPVGTASPTTTTFQNTPTTIPVPAIEPAQNTPIEAPAPVESAPEPTISDLINQELNNITPSQTPPQI
jgi:CheY-like chemotaxis protein